MKTIKKLQTEIDDKINEIKNYSGSDFPKDKRKVKAAKLRLAYLKMCKMYIDSNPTEEFLLKERDRLSNRVSAFLKNYTEPANVTKTEATKDRKKFETEMGILKIRKQLTALNFLLN